VAGIRGGNGSGVRERGDFGHTGSRNGRDSHRGRSDSRDSWLVWQLSSVYISIGADAAAGLQKEMEGLSVKRATAPTLDVWSNDPDQYNRNWLQLGHQTRDGEFRLQEAAKQHMEVQNYMSRVESRTSNERSSPSTQAIFNLQSAGITPGTGDFQAAALRAAAQSNHNRSDQAANQRAIAVGHGTPNIPCNSKTCLRKFDTQIAANDHMAAVGHVNPTILCKTCLKKFDTQIAANDHMAATRHGIPNIPCKSKTCAKKFFTQGAVNDHMAAVKH
jgi:hypothetical protein